MENGAKEIGIVLTPRHITRFAVQVVDVEQHDVVCDPTCGTGGFLISALDHVKTKHKTPNSPTGGCIQATSTIWDRARPHRDGTRHCEHDFPKRR